MKTLYDLIVDNKDFIQVCASVIIGLSTLVISVISVCLLKQQNKIQESQNRMQNLMHQPVFEISIRQQQDSDDGKYGSDIMYVNNIGERMTSCSVSTTVFFSLSKHKVCLNDTIYIKVDDYFIFACSDDSDSKCVKKFFCPGNNRVFCNGYFASIEDSKETDCYYFYDKIILVKIVYVDIFKEKHTMYFERNNEIDEKTYQHYFDKNNEVFEGKSFTLNNVDYHKMKELLDKRSVVK